MHFEFLGYGTSIPRQIWMQIFVTIILVVVLWKNRRDSLLIFLTMLFFPRVFIFMGKDVENLYKVTLLLMCIYTGFERKIWKKYSIIDQIYLFVFIVFSSGFFYSTLFYSHDGWTIIFSQYARYLEMFLLWFILKDAIYYRNQKDKLLKFLYEILLIQIIISIFKLIIFKEQIEGLVGSLSIYGGEYGTTLPIVGFYILYIYRKGVFKSIDWLTVIGLFLIGWTSAKRAVWLLLPLVIVVFFTYVRGIKFNKYMALGILAFPLFIYLGARLTPSLNPDHKVWGNFDLEFMWDYANTYQFGEEGIEGQREALEEKTQMMYKDGMYGLRSDRIEATGRGNATIELFKLILGPRSLSEQDIWGTGLSTFYSTTYEEFDKLPLTIHLSYKGAGTGFFQMYATIGVIGAILMIIFALIPYFRIRSKRFRWVMMGIFLYDYFMYNASTCRDTHLVAMIFICIYVVNVEYMMYKKIKHQPQSLFTETVEDTVIIKQATHQPLS